MRYAILTTPRTGSNVLCDLLAQTGAAGMRDLYDAGFFIGYGEGTQQAYAEGAVEQYFARNRTPNGVEGCKVGLDYIEHLNHQLPFGAVDDILSRFDRFIVLRREDVVAQAVSRLIARQTGEWTSEDRRRLRHIPEPVAYDRARIAYFIADARAAHMFFDAWLAERGIEPLRMTYEENAADWGHAVERVLRFVGAEAGATVLKPTLEKQSDPCKAEFIARYRAERGVFA